MRGWRATVQWDQEFAPVLQRGEPARNGPDDVAEDQVADFRQAGDTAQRAAQSMSRRSCAGTAAVAEDALTGQALLCKGQQRRRGQRPVTFNQQQNRQAIGVRERQQRPVDLLVGPDPDVPAVRARLRVKALPRRGARLGQERRRPRFAHDPPSLFTPDGKGHFRSEDARQKRGVLRNGLTRGQPPRHLDAGLRQPARLVSRDETDRRSGRNAGPPWTIADS